jgi:hypothetical protein
MAMSVLLVHGAGYASTVAKWFLERQRLGAGLMAGFVAADRIKIADALHRDTEVIPFTIGYSEYREALQQPDSASEEPTRPLVTLPAGHDWLKMPKLRCLCCPPTSTPTRLLNEKTGNAATELTSVTRQVIRHRWPDVHRYLTRKPGRARAIDIVCSDIAAGARVVVAHSLGSLVTLDALARVPAEALPELLVTIGSPLQLKAVRDSLEAPASDWIRSRSTAWINVHDKSDRVTGGGSLDPAAFPGVINIAVRNGRHTHAADYYLRHPIVGNVIWAVASDRLTATALKAGIPAEFAIQARYRRAPASASDHQPEPPRGR